MIIDIHSHMVDPAMAQYMATEPNPNMFDVSWLLDEQEKAGVDLTIISNPSVIERTLEKSQASVLKVARAFDDYMAGLVQAHEGRLLALAVTYPFGGEPFLKELERAVVELGLKGVMVNPRYTREFLDAQRAVPFFELACQLDIPVYLHPPIETIGAEFMREFRLVEMVGRPCETTLGLARLIYYGVLERFPKLKIVASHLGGGIMMLPGRLNYGYEGKEDHSFGIWGPDYLKTTPGEYLKRIYVDTVSFHPPAVRCAIDTVGLDHVMLGSDFPPVPQPLVRTLGTVKALGLSPADEAKVLGGNARVLFKI